MTASLKETREPRRYAAAMTSAPTPTGLKDRPTVAPARPGTGQPRRNPVRRIVPKPAGGRLGSNQVVSIRGRQTTQPRQVNRIIRIGAFASALLMVGVLIAMTLSGLSTQQTFELQDLKTQENHLNNELETLKRDLETSRSSANLGQKAKDLGMVVPNQPGILSVNGEGAVDEVRPALEDFTPMENLNDAAGATHKASSNPDKTKDVSQNLHQRPQAGRQTPAPQAPAAQAPAAQAPAAAPAPAPAAADGALPPYLR